MTGLDPLAPLVKLRSRVAAAISTKPLRERSPRDRARIALAVIAVHPLRSVRWRRTLLRMVIAPPPPRQPPVPLSDLFGRPHHD